MNQQRIARFGPLLPHDAPVAKSRSLISFENARDCWFLARTGAQEVNMKRTPPEYGCGSDRCAA
jgi:hypothetical protein